LGQHDDRGARAVFLTDDLDRYLYVLHMPDKEKAHAELVLHFRK
jgi:hypothetical protein